MEANSAKGKLLSQFQTGTLRNSNVTEIVTNASESLARLKTLRITAAERLMKYQILESLILAQDERWRRA